ncbi:MAG: hypothetical protein CM15mP113_3170 [Pseudomonadota bacterium]|nr:MAG: hypothetical protein CM15mP113_3170 [Pseudomonadota bacterium]
MLVFDGWSEILQPSIKRVLGELTSTPLKAYIDEIWRNKYTKGSFQEIHHHHGADISFTIFCNDFNETSSEFFFYNESSRYMDFRFRQIMEETGSLFMDDSWTLVSMKGDIIFFLLIFKGVQYIKMIVRTTVSGNMIIHRYNFENFIENMIMLFKRKSGYIVNFLNTCILIPSVVSNQKVEVDVKDSWIFHLI